MAGSARCDDPPLVGREQEVRVLVRGLAGAARGAGGTVLIEGEPGIGKSRLVQEVVQRARAEGFTVAAAAATEQDRHRPFSAVGAAFELVATNADRRRVTLAALLDRADDGGRWTILDAIERLAAELAHERPLLVAFDDLQWADPSSQLAAWILARQLRGHDALVVLAYRRTGAPPELRRFAESAVASGAARLRPSPLSPTEAVTLASALAPAPVDAVDLTAAAGNPLLVIELARHGTSRPEAITNPLRDLPAGAVDVLEAAAILGSPFSVMALATMLERPTVGLLPTLDAALADGLLVEDGDRLAFRHRLLLDAVAARIPDGDRARLHRRAANALLAAGAPISAVVGHLVAGTTSGDRDTALWIAGAARDGLAQAPPAAVSLFEHALELLGPDDPEASTIRADLIDALVWSGRVDDVTNAAADLLAAPLGPDQQREVRLRLSEAELLAGRHADCLSNLVALTKPPTDPVTRCRALARAAIARLLLADVPGANADAIAARDLADDADDPLGMAAGRSAEAAVMLFGGHSAEAAKLSEAAVGHVEHAADRTLSLATEPRLFHGLILAEADRLTDSAMVLRHGIDVGRARGAAWSLPLYHWGLSVTEFYAGRWDEALAAHSTGTALAIEMGLGLGVLWSSSIPALVALPRGDLRTARAALAEADALAGGTAQTFGIDWALWARGLIAEASGDRREALAILSTCFDLYQSIGGRGSYLRTVGPDLVRIALDAGDDARAGQVADAIGHAASIAGVPSATGAAQRAAGLVEQSPSLLVDAARSFTAAGRPVPAALAREEAGLLIARDGRRDGARPLLADALAAYEQRGATRHAARLRHGAAAAGIRFERAAAPATGDRWHTLSPAQRRVARLASEGLSNPAIADALGISRRTVETHLAQVFVKLGVSSRHDLSAPETVGPP